MKSALHCSLYLRLLFALVITLSQFAEAEEPEGPEYLVQLGTEKVTNQLKHIPQPRDITRIETVLNRYLLKHVDQERVAKLVLGKHWKKASFKQKQDFLDCFSRQLIRTYAESFSRYKGETWNVHTTEFNETRTKAAVYLAVDRMPLPMELIFRLYKSKSGWRLYDLSIDKISLIKNYRDDYASKIKQQGLSKSLATLCKTFPDTTPELILAGNSWPPYIGQGLPGNGLSVEIVSAVLHKAGYKTEMMYAPWSKVTKGMMELDYDVSIATWYSEERSKGLLFSDPYYINKLVSVTHVENSPPPDSTDAFKDAFKKPEFRLGIMEDYAYGEIIPPNTPTQKFQHYSALFRDLAGKKIGVSLMEKAVAQFYIYLQPPLKKQLVISDKTLQERALHITMLRKHTDADKVISRFNQQLKTYLTSDEYQDLLKKYNLNIE